MATVHESYRDYRAPRWIRPTVERLLAAIPAAHLSGLGTVVLTDAAAVGVGKTRRVGRPEDNRSACLGFYHRKHGGTPAAVEIVVDNAVAGWPAFVFALNLFRDMVLARVLFHELGHHLDATIGAAAPTGEAAAEDWNRRLGRLSLQASLLVAASIRRHGQTCRALDALARAEEEGRIGTRRSPCGVGADRPMRTCFQERIPQHGVRLGGGSLIRRSLFLKPKVYLETTVISYLTAAPSRDIVQAAHQQITREWWERRKDFDLFVSQAVITGGGSG